MKKTCYIAHRASNTLFLTFLKTQQVLLNVPQQWQERAANNLLDVLTTFRRSQPL